MALTSAAGSRRRQAPSFDTVTLRHLCVAPCLDGFKFIRDERGERYAYNLRPKDGPARPHLTYSVDPTGRGHLLARVSLPRMLYGNNVETIAAEDIPRGLEIISDFVRRVTGVEFDARTSSVCRLDVFHTCQVGEDTAYNYLHALAAASLPRMLRRRYDTGVEWRNKTQKNIAYAKLAETLHRATYGKATKEEVRAALGHLRIEAQFLTSDSIRRLAKNRLKLPDRRADLLLRPEVAEAVMREMLANLGLDRPIPPAAARVALLREFYGPGPTFSRLCRFLKALEERGEEAVKQALSYETFRATRAELQAAGVWLVNPSGETLPPLLIGTPPLARAAAPTGRG